MRSGSIPKPEGDKERDNKIKLANFESSIKQGF